LPKKLLAITLILPIIVLSFFAVNNLAIERTDKQTDNLRKVLGFPSLAIGNLNPASRQPGLEIFCTSIYDVPGSDCHYFTYGIYSDFHNYTANISGVTK
jgi:hypothetical protein